MKELDARLKKQLETRKEEHAYRRLTIPSGLIDFCSNDYLGLSANSKLRADLLQHFMAYPIGSTGSRLITGHSLQAQELEQKLAAYHSAEAALLFNSGYTANLGLLATVPQRNDTIIYDQLSHASIREGIQLSKARSFAFRHNDVTHLKEKLSRATGQIFVVIESVYSMDGDFAPLSAITALLDDYNAVLIVDEAHATGVVGKKGEGLVASLGLEEKVWARIVTFGKAIGSHGAIVLGNKLLMNYLVNYARSFIYTTAMPPHSMKAIELAYEMLENRGLLEQLRSNICLFKGAIDPVWKDQFIESDSAIQSLLCPGNEQARALAKSLQEQGFDLRAILSPTVPKGKERIRICIHAFNTESQLLDLAKAINKKLGEK